MILNNFKKNNLFLQFFFIAVAFVSLFFYPIEIVKPQEYSVLYSSIYNILLPIPLFTKIISLFSVLLIALFSNYLMRRFELWPRNNYLPMLVYIILMGAFPILLNFNPLTLASILILCGFYYLFRVNEEEYIYSMIFSSSLLFGLATLIYLPFIAIIVLLPFVYIIFRVFRGREMIISLIAFIIPWVFVAVYYFLNDVLSIRFYEFVNVIANFSFPSIKSFTIRDTSLAIFFILLALLVAFRVLLIAYEQLIQVRILTSFTVVYLLFTTASIGLAGKYFLVHPLLILFPLTVVFSSFLKGIKNTFYFDLFLILLIIAEYANAIFQF